MLVFIVCASIISMTVFENKKPQYVDLKDGRTVLDMREVVEDTALFSYVMDNPRHRQTLESLVDSKDTQGLYKWINLLEQKVIANGAQKSYLSDVFRDCVFQKYPEEKGNYEKLKQGLSLGVSAVKPLNLKDDISNPLSM